MAPGAGRELTGMRKTRAHACIARSALLIVLAAAGSARAADGVVEINQSRALAGGVTPGDTAGFPVTLSEPGSYRLTGNLRTSSPSEVAIQITAAHVTLDLGGFGIRGVTDCSSFPCANAGGGSGVLVYAAGASDVTVHGGSVTAMGAYGVYADVEHVRVEQTRLVGNGAGGLVVGPNGWVHANTVADNGGIGIAMGNGTSFAHNQVEGNSGAAVSGGLPDAGNRCDDGSCERVVLRRFLKSSSQNTAGLALGQCPAGFHMASLWEIQEVSTLRYTGFALGDQGSGPNTSLPAWIRTGSIFSSTSSMPGIGNCALWSSSGSGDFGTAANLWWDAAVTGASFPWQVNAFTCDTILPVWCVED